jgi:hypothetical protein
MAFRNESASTKGFSVRQFIQILRTEFGASATPVQLDSVRRDEHHRDKCGNRKECGEISHSKVIHIEWLRAMKDSVGGR